MDAAGRLYWDVLVTGWPCFMAGSLPRGYRARCSVLITPHLPLSAHRFPTTFSLKDGGSGGYRKEANKPRRSCLVSTWLA
ncbi:hypothetical protein GGTG_12276 [Gaeumannomyces tritici R3-111a-1]|uniref:Uncharacterized protein n=1 Tax=Gaeumannomyces tritici (strain R3-111a-1) TaxID=644352 RepID=J3PFK1_GAET3|nr:hypothetical protein GGTG_12276 [Gaeumannomyces tritici R3-111a-1]EJT70103.1 hypothetical protein GGTG_12276 [Gaeumannomyces tritici R3-111a-1]